MSLHSFYPISIIASLPWTHWQSQYETSTSRKALYTIYFQPRQSEHITPFRRRLGWLSVKNRRLFFLGIMTYKVWVLEVPAYISELFSDSTERSETQRLSRHSNMPTTFHIPIHKTITYRNSFRLSTIYLWESLQGEITSATSFGIFKTRLLTYLHSSKLHPD